MLYLLLIYKEMYIYLKLMKGYNCEHTLFTFQAFREQVNRERMLEKCYAA